MMIVSNASRMVMMLWRVLSNSKKWVTKIYSAKIADSAAVPCLPHPLTQLQCETDHVTDRNSRYDHNIVITRNASGSGHAPAGK